MDGHMSKHAGQRAQQRGVPPLIASLLLDFGEEFFDGRGAIIRYFSRRSIRKVERAVGSVIVGRLSEYFRCYLVEDAANGTIITIGKRDKNKHLRRH